MPFAATLGVLVDLLICRFAVLLTVEFALAAAPPVTCVLVTLALFWMTVPTLAADVCKSNSTNPPTPGSSVGIATKLMTPLASVAGSVAGSILGVPGATGPGALGG